MNPVPDKEHLGEKRILGTLNHIRIVLGVKDMAVRLAAGGWDCIIYFWEACVVLYRFS